MGVVFDPRSKALVTGNLPGVLQFYLPTTDHHALSVSLQFISLKDPQADQLIVKLTVWPIDWSIVN